MIINASGRCDIVAYYMPWFIERIKAGFVDVRNPYYPTLVSRISLLKQDVDGIVFCTKNPLPLLQYQEELKDYPLFIQVTITPYRKDIEPFVIDKRKVIAAFIELSKRYGKSCVQLRYDPILINATYTMDYHFKMFERLCEQCSDYTDTIIISFVDKMKNTLKHQKEMALIDLDETTIRQLAYGLSNIAKKYKMKIKTCAEAYDLQEFGIVNEPCFGMVEYYSMTGRIKRIKKGKTRKHCDCLSMADVGAYNCCAHYCQYCYANYDEDIIEKNRLLHDAHSTMILGKLQKEDQIKERRN